MNGTDLNVPGVLLNHEGRISTVETILEERKPDRVRFDVKDLASFLPGLFANALAFALLWAGKISVLQWLSLTGSGK